MPGNLFGLAHNGCNLKQKIPVFIPVFFHNLSRYDSNHLIWYLILLQYKKLIVVPCTDENYVSFSLHIPLGEFDDKKGRNRIKIEEMRFLDSFRFLPDSLDNLSKSLNNENFKILKHFFPSEEKRTAPDSRTNLPLFLHLSLRKISQKIDSKVWHRLDECCLWHNKRVRERERERDVIFAEKVWKTFECKIYGNYHDLY